MWFGRHLSAQWKLFVIRKKFASCLTILLLKPCLTFKFELTPVRTDLAYFRWLFFNLLFLLLDFQAPGGFLTLQNSHPLTVASTRAPEPHHGWKISPHRHPLRTVSDQYTTYNAFDVHYWLRRQESLHFGKDHCRWRDHQIGPPCKILPRWQVLQTKSDFEEEIRLVANPTGVNSVELRDVLEILLQKVPSVGKRLGSCVSNGRGQWTHKESLYHTCIIIQSLWKKDCRVNKIATYSYGNDFVSRGNLIPNSERI